MQITRSLVLLLAGSLTLTAQSERGNNTGIEVPGDLIEQLAAGKRPPVLVNVNGYEYRNTVAVMGGRHMISISAASPSSCNPGWAPKLSGPRSAPRST